MTNLFRKKNSQFILCPCHPFGLYGLFLAGEQLKGPCTDDRLLQNQCNVQ